MARHVTRFSIMLSLALTNSCKELNASLNPEGAEPKRSESLLKVPVLTLVSLGLSQAHDIRVTARQALERPKSAGKPIHVEIR